MWNKLERSPESVAPEEILKAIFVGNRLDMDRLSKMADINYISMYLSNFKDTVKSARFNKIKMLYKIARNTIVFDLDTGEVFDKNIKSWRWPTDGELADVFFGEELSDVGDLNPDTISYKKDEDGNDGRLDLRDEDGNRLATLRVDEPPEYEISWHNLSRKHVDSRPKNMTLPDGNSVTIKEIKLASDKVIKELIKLANKLDEQELYEEADKLDKIIEDSAKEDIQTEEPSASSARTEEENIAAKAFEKYKSTFPPLGIEELINELRYPPGSSLTFEHATSLGYEDFIDLFTPYSDERISLAKLQGKELEPKLEMGDDGFWYGSLIGSNSAATYGRTSYRPKVYEITIPSEGIISQATIEAFSEMHPNFRRWNPGLKHYGSTSGYINRDGMVRIPRSVVDKIKPENIKEVE